MQFIIIYQTKKQRKLTTVCYRENELDDVHRVSINDLLARHQIKIWHI